MSLRPARAGDLDTLRRFEQGIVAAERPFDPTLRDAGVHYYDFDRLLLDPQSLIMVAEHAGEAIGSGLARIDAAKPYFRHTRQAYLGLMFVEPAWRGRGVNARLLAALKEWSRKNGVHELRLDVYADNGAARRAYEGAGFRPHMLEMRAALEE